MAASASFQELQRRGLCVNAAALCETMDLIALILPERRIAVHRSFTW